MAIHEFPLPDLGEGLTEGEILKWLVSEGDTVTQNQPIVEVETAKAAVEIPAKWPGTVVKIFHPEGTTVAVGTPIVSIDTGGGSAPAESAAESAAEPAAAPAEASGGQIGEVTATGRTAVLVGYGSRTTTAKRRPRKSTPAPAPTAPAPAAAPTPPVPAPTAPAPTSRAMVLAKPPVRKLARDLGVDLATVTGTGPAGSITRADVEAAVAQRSLAPSVSTAPAFGPDREQRIPIKGVRKLTAENMVASAFTAPHVTEFLTVDVTRGMRALKRLRKLPGWEEVRVTPLLLVAKAVLL